MDSRTLFRQAMEQYKNGHLTEAERLYRFIISRGPPQASILHLLGTIRSQLGHHEEALDLIAQALELSPRDASIQWSCANELNALERFEEAVIAYDRAIALSPQFPEAFYNRGIAFSRLKRHKDALASFDGALHINPRSFDAFYQRGCALEELSQPQMALQSYTNALAIKPNSTPALDKVARLLGKIGRPGDALAYYERAMHWAPKDIPVLQRKAQLLLAIHRPDAALSDFDKILSIDRMHVGAIRGRAISIQSLGFDCEALAFLKSVEAYLPNAIDPLYLAGVIHQKLGQSAEALVLYDKVLALDSTHAAAWNNRGVVLQSQGKLPEAVQSFKKALSADPDHADAWANLGDFHKSQGRPDEALDCYNTCLDLKPDAASALHSRGLLFWEDFGDFDSASRDLSRAYELQPQSPYLLGDIIHLHMQLADWASFAEDRAALERALQAGKQVARPFMYQAIGNHPAHLELCAKIFTANNFPARPAIARSHRRPGGKIRLGYVSGEFRDQATAQLMAGLYEKHDKTRFELIAFDNGRNDASSMRTRLEQAFDKIVDISVLSDVEAAESIDAYGIDILVNLNGYFGKARMGVFAQRPAPVQVNYLGFPCTLGADYMDYIIADRHVIPDEERRYFTENVVYLPDTYQANDSKRFLPTATPPREIFHLPENAVVFCNFNLSYKLAPDTFRCWMSILTEVKDSVLWLLESSGPFRDNLRRHAASHGIEPSRLIFAPYAPTDHHLTRLGLADLCLDSLPYNAHTTASDALWAAVPLLTCTGTTFAGRVATSLLHAIGMPELVTTDMQAYRDTAIFLAKDPARLRALRGKLLNNRFQYPLFDTDRFRSNLEAAFTIMHERATRGEPPTHFSTGR